MPANLMSRSRSVKSRGSALPLSGNEGGQQPPSVPDAPTRAQNPKDGDAVDRMTKIVRRHAHDVRNHLNVLDFDATLLGALISQPEAVAILQRMRVDLAQLDAAVKALGLRFEAPRPVVVAAGDLLQLWKLEVNRMGLVGSPVDWSAVHETAPVTVDPNAVVSVLREVTLAACKRACGLPLKASVWTDGASVVVDLLEPAHGVPMPEDLIEESARLIKANGGRLSHIQNAATQEWLTTLTFASGAP